MFSKTCQYGIQGVLYIALNSSDSKPIGLKEIAKSQNLPAHFLGKILQLLAKKKVIKSIKGPNGGFYLSKPASKIKLIDIYDVIDGMENMHACVLGFDECRADYPCPLHHSYVGIRDNMLQLLTTKSIQDLCTDVEAQKSFVAYTTH